MKLFAWQTNFNFRWKLYLQWKAFAFIFIHTRPSCIIIIVAVFHEWQRFSKMNSDSYENYFTRKSLESFHKLLMIRHVHAGNRFHVFITRRSFIISCYCRRDTKVCNSIKKQLNKFKENFLYILKLLTKIFKTVVESFWKKYESLSSCTRREDFIESTNKSFSFAGKF